MVWKKDRYIVIQMFVSSPIKILCSPKSGSESARVYHKSHILGGCQGPNQIHYCSNEGEVLKMRLIIVGTLVIIYILAALKAH